MHHLIYTGEAKSNLADLKKQGQIKKLKKIPRAFLCVNDLLAFLTIETATSLGLKIPDDLAVAGFDNYCPSMPNTITSVDIFAKELGALATNVLFFRIKNPAIPYYMTRLKSKIIYRETTNIAKD